VPVTEGFLMRLKPFSLKINTTTLLFAHPLRLSC
jgi:hypothetical protein